LVEK
jgi:hypothetical protein